MAKSLEYNKAQSLRKQGESIRDIARKVGVSKSTVSLWCRDIRLKPAQIKRLIQNKLSGLSKGRLRGAQVQYQRRIKRTRELEEKGQKLFGQIHQRDIFAIGLGLYWGEGTTFGRVVSFTNSDPFIIKFILNWFKEVFRFDAARFKFYILINEIHKARVGEVLRYWIQITGFPKESFGKTTLIKAKNKKQYNNFPKHYGTLKIDIKRPTEVHHQIIGMLKKIEMIYGV